MINANIRKGKTGYVRAECGKCGRFLAEVRGNTHTVAKCSSCGNDNSIHVCYANPYSGRGEAQ